MGGAGGSELLIVLVVGGLIVGVIWWITKRNKSSAEEQRLHGTEKGQQFLEARDQQSEHGGLLSPRGRITRGSWLMAQIAAVFVPVVTVLVGIMVAGLSMDRLLMELEYYGPIEFILGIIEFVPVLALFIIVGFFGQGYVSWVADIKRLHDTGHSGWLSVFRLVGGIPYIGWIMVLVYWLYLLIASGNQHENQYGSDPSGRPEMVPVNRPSIPASAAVEPAPVESNESLEVLSLRLAAGEITVEEFNEVKGALKDV